MEEKHPSYWIRIPVLTIDLLTAAVLYLISFIVLYNVFFRDTPTAYELGYNIGSQQVVIEQLLVVLFGALVWLVYSLIVGLVFSKSFGHLLLGLKLSSHDNSKFRNIFSITFSPLIFFDKLLGVTVVRSRKINLFTKIITVLASLGSLIAIPGLLFYVFMIFFLLIPRAGTDDNFTLCGERFCLVKANTSCKKNLDFISSRVVEIVGKNFTGTGFLISDSLVLTNYHVIEEETVVLIRESNGRISKANVYNVNPNLDIAILVGQFTKGEHIQFVNPTDFKEGTTDLYAIGFPSSVLRQTGTGTLTVTSGVYSAFLDYKDEGFQLV